MVGNAEGRVEYSIARFPFSKEMSTSALMRQLQTLYDEVIQELASENQNVNQFTESERDYEYGTCTGTISSCSNLYLSPSSQYQTTAIMYSSYASSLGSPAFSRPQSIRRVKSGKLGGSIPDNDGKTKLQLLQSFHDVLECYLSLLSTYQQHIKEMMVKAGSYQPAMQKEIRFEDYWSLDKLLDELGKINDSAAERKPESRGCIHIFGASRIGWIKAVYHKIIMRWAWSQIEPQTSLAPNACVSEKEHYTGGKEKHSTVSIAWSNGDPENHLYLILKVLWRVAQVIVDTALFLREEGVAILSFQDGINQKSRRCV
ncbi:hypothetical protein DFH27DRAFT_521390 [Peziza echinospora]|nr:hypothetical protein DFH27DRAFT_521390 [Peziza echinospora]